MTHREELSPPAAEGTKEDDGPGLPLPHVREKGS